MSYIVMTAVTLAALGVFTAHVLLVLHPDLFCSTQHYTCTLQEPTSLDPNDCSRGIDESNEEECLK